MQNKSDGENDTGQAGTVERIHPSLSKMAPACDLPLSLPPPLSPFLSLGHKSVVVYENLQQSNATLRRSVAFHWLQQVTWQGAVIMNFLHIISFTGIEQLSFYCLSLPPNPFRACVSYPSRIIFHRFF